MNKRILALLIAMGSLAASNAFASRATNLVEGTGDAGTVLNGGSFFYDDNYNIFYNPAYVNDFKNWAIIEKSNYAGFNVPINGGAASQYGTTAQGGFIASIGNFNVGVYLNRAQEVVTYNGIGLGANTQLGIGNDYVNVPVRPFEVFIGSDMGVKWGFSVGYAANFQPASVSSDVVLNAGAEYMNLDPFVSWKVQGNDGSGPGNSFFRVGTRYHWGEWIPYVAYVNLNNNTGGTTLVSERTIGGGIGRSTKIADGVRMNYALSYWNVQDQNAGTTVGTRNIVPIDFAMEGDPASWITLRAGLSYHAVDRVNASVGDFTTGRLGATIHAGKADFEFAVGKANFTQETATNTEYVPGGVGGATTNYPLDAQAFDIGDNFFTAANMAYHW